MSLKTRIDRLRHRIGKPPCECESAPVTWVTWFACEPEPVVERCPKCGRPLQSIIRVNVTREVGEFV